ncbi:Alpha/Beta hydrolase protein [Phaeosphaeria sp. MPI-PUGE-AT-0046c]|nr:Alpha/Beta hydrolase protein [Phaeosphaeria sp. MPI-PUGE-AT-0046c]
MSSTFTFNHAQLGPMTGVITPDNVVQFRAIPYATIPARFKQSVLKTDSGGETDFTKHGYACPQTFPPSVAAGGPVPGGPEIPLADEFKCLILQINVPLKQLQSPSQDKLPLLVYIHGGGFVLGRIDEQHNTALMVQQSLADAQPIIGISLQYRLGALGYLHPSPSPEHANLALHDQRNALLWIQRFISGFGGDSSQVTLFGESGGAMSICAQMLFPAPSSGRLFRRAILMSGVLGPGTAPGTRDEANGVYEMFLQKLGIEDRGQEGLEEMRNIELDKIVKATKEFAEEGLLLRTVRTEEWLGEGWEGMTWERIPEAIGRCEWVEEIVLGTTSFEGTTFMARVAGITPREWISSITSQLGQEGAEMLCKAYKVTPDMDHNLFTTSALRWIGDVIFEAPLHAWSKHLSTHTSKKLYSYVFDVRNPFPSHPLYQLPHHWVDKYFVFKTLQFRYPSQRLKDISTKHAQFWIDVANGKVPWSEYRYSGNGDEVIMVADEREGWVERTLEKHEEIMETTSKRCDMLLESWKGMQGRTFTPLEIDAFKGKSMV